MATTLRRGSLLIISVALLLGLVGCSGNNVVENYTPIDTRYSGQSDNEYYESAIVDTAEQMGTAHQVNTIAEDYIIEITEPGFDIQIKEIQINRNDFLGRTIRYEGMFLSAFWEDETFYFVARLEGGCCGLHGFEVYLNDISRVDDETWVEVTGVLEEFYVEDFSSYILRLNVIALVER